MSLPDPSDDKHHPLNLGHFSTKTPSQLLVEINKLTLGRKNYLFAGSDEGGRRAAIRYTLIGTARHNGFDPQAWLTDGIARIADYPSKRLDDLLPWSWASTQPRQS